MLSFAAVNLAVSLASAQATVRVEPFKMQGQRLLQTQTRESVIRDYLHSWQSLSLALDLNSADELETDFVGTAKEMLSSTIEGQKAIGVHTRYMDRAHDLQIVFYSPDGLSIEMTDNVEYDVQLIDKNVAHETEHLNARYIVILTPTETRWRVRIFQAVSE